MLKNNPVLRIILHCFLVMFTILFIDQFLYVFMANLVAEEKSYFLQLLYLFVTVFVSLLPLILIFALLAFFMLKPLLKTLHHIQNNLPVAPEDKEKSKRILIQLPRIVMLLNLVVFILITVLEALLWEWLSSPVVLVLQGIFNLLLGVFSGFIQNNLNTMYLSEVREIIGVYSIPEDHQKLKSGIVRKRVKAMTLLIVFFMVFIYYKLAWYFQFEYSYMQLLEQVAREELTFEQAKEEYYSLIEYFGFASILGYWDQEQVKEAFIVPFEQPLGTDYKMRIWTDILFAFMMVFILYTILFVYTSNRIITIQLNQFRKKMQDILKDESDFGKRVQIIDLDEIGYLANDINKVISKFQTIYHQLNHYSQDLEDQVQERTQQLLEKNHQLNATLDQLKSFQEKIIFQEKMASLGLLTAGIAHEIKNPLNFITNFSEIMIELIDEMDQWIKHLSDKSGDAAPTIKEIQNHLDQLKSNANKIVAHGKRADNIVKSMLQHSRGEEGVFEPLDINGLLNEAILLSYHSMRASDFTFQAKMEMHLDENLPPIPVIYQDINRVFLNIFNNGFYFVHKKKQRLNGDFVPKVSVQTSQTEDQIIIQIRDNGEGISKEHLKTIFNPFFTTKSPGEGIGLGLFISYDIIKKEHKGDIIVQSQVGEYTEITIYLNKTHNLS